MVVAETNHCCKLGVASRQPENSFAILNKWDEQSDGTLTPVRRICYVERGFINSDRTLVHADNEFHRLMT